jgi:O-antigen ligase
VPLLLSSHAGNPLPISKNDSLTIIGGIFIILSSFLLFYGYKNKKKAGKGLYFEKEVDPYVTLFFIAAVISSIFSVNFYVSYFGYYTRPLGLEMYLYIFLVYIFSSVVLQDNRRIQDVMFIMECCAVIVSLYALVQYSGNDPLNLQAPEIRRPVSTLGNGVFLGGFLILVFPFSLMRTIQNRKFNISALFPFLILSAVIISQTRTAYAAVVVEIAIIILFYFIVTGTEDTGLYRKIKYSVLILGGIVILLCLLILFERDNVYVKRFINITALFQNPRWLLWGESLKVFAKNPITGCGLCTFPAVFETVYSMSFKLNDVRNYYDNAHSNFVHTLCSMGILGFIAYLLLLGHTIYIHIKSIFSKILKPKQKLFYIGFFAMVCGYIIYGIADFDEVSIMFYFFIYLSILKMQFRSDNISQVYVFPSRIKPSLNKGVVVVFFLLSVFIFYNIYLTVRQISADRNFLTAYSLSSQKKFQVSFNYYLSAIELWESNSFYHYEYGGALLDYAVSDIRLNIEMKNNFLEKARSELLTATANYPSKNTCMGLVSIVDFELGNTTEAEKIENELLGRDSLLINYRFALADYFIQNREYNKAMDQLLFNCKYDPGDNRLSRTITVLLNDKNCPDPLSYCNKILAVDPKNEAAIYFMKMRK